MALSPIPRRAAIDVCAWSIEGGRVAFNVLINVRDGAFFEWRLVLFLSLCTRSEKERLFC